MVTPKVITFIYWLLLLSIVIGALLGFLNAIRVMEYSFLMGFGAMILVPIGALLGALVARMYCELMIVLFRIYETLIQIREK